MEGAPPERAGARRPQAFAKGSRPGLSPAGAVVLAALLTAAAPPRASAQSVEAASTIWGVTPYQDDGAGPGVPALSDSASVEERAREASARVTVLADSPTSIRIARRTLPPVWVTGGLITTAAYLGSVIMGSFNLDRGFGYLDYAPLVGPIVRAAVIEAHDTAGAILDIVLGAAQLGGFFVFLIGAIARVEEYVPVYDAERPPLTPRLAAGPGEVGASLAWDF